MSTEPLQSPLSDSLLQLGRRLKERRKQLRMPAKEAAAAAGITPTYLWMLEAGANPKTKRPSRPSVDVLAKLVAILQLPPDEIFALAGYPLLRSETSRDGQPSVAAEPPTDVVGPATFAPDHLASPRWQSRPPTPSDVPAPLRSSGKLGAERMWPPLDDGVLPRPEHFIGRDADLIWLLERLRSGGAASITALGGLGGIGKTALVAVALRQLRTEGRFPDGIAVVRCQGMTDATQVLHQALARFHPRRRQPETSDLIALTEIAQGLLDEKEALIVLDDVEPGLPIEQVVAPLRAAGASLLVTARQALLRSTVPVDATRVLGLLDPDAALDLFAQSFGRQGAQDISPAERPAAERIVAALECHTLAVRLAGAYAADLGRDLEALARELQEDPLELPEGEIPRAVERSFAQSIRALPNDALRLFTALPVFASSVFGRQAALALGAGLGLSEPDANLNLLVLRGLLDATRNLAMPEQSDRERLRLHPLLRSLAAARFKQLPQEEQDAPALALARYYSVYARDTVHTGRATDEANITYALEWAHEHRQDELVVALCSSMESFWHDRAHTAASLRYLPWGLEAEARLRARARRQPGARETSDLFRLLLTDGHTMQVTGALDRAMQRYERALALARETNARLSEGTALARLGRIAQRRGQLDEAEGYLRQALEIANEVQDRSGQATAFTWQGQVASARGRPEEAEGYFTQALAIRRDLQDRRGEGVILAQLGQVAHVRGQLDEAEDYLRQALEIAREVQDRRGQAMALTWLGQVASARGQLDRAEDAFRRSLVIHREVLDRRGEALDLSRLGQVAQQRGRLEEAEDYLRRSLDIHREVQNRRGEGVDLMWLGQIAQTRGEPEEAERYYQEALGIACEVHDRRNEGLVLAQLGQLAQQRGSLNEAENRLRQSLRIRREVQDRQGEGMDLRHLSQIATQRGQSDAAEDYLRQSLQIAAEMRDRRGEGTTLAQLGHVAHWRGRLDQAQEHLRRALDLAREVPDRICEGTVLRYLGRVARDRGSLDDAQVYFEHGLIIAREMQDRLGEGSLLAQLGRLDDWRGRLDQAEAYLQESLAIARDVQNRRGEGENLSDLGWLAHTRGQFDQAESYYRQSLAICREVQDRPGEGYNLQRLGEAAHDRGLLDEAEEYVGRSLAIWREAHNRRGEGSVLALSGQIAQARGRLDEAERYYRESLVIRREVQDRRGECRDLGRLGLIAEARGDLDRAEALLREGLAIARDVQGRIRIAELLLELGRFLVEHRDNRDEGCQMLREAVRLYAEMGLPREQQARATAQRLGCAE